MGKIIKKNVVTRKPGHLYYVDGQGNVCEAKMSRGGKKKKAVKKKPVKKAAKKTVKKTVKRKTTRKKPMKKKR